VKHLHYEGNLDVVCRALNLAQNNFSSEMIHGISQRWTAIEEFAPENSDFEVEDDEED